MTESPGTPDVRTESVRGGDADPAVRARRPPRFRLGDTTRKVVIAVLILGSLAGIGVTGMIAVTGTSGTSDALPESVDRLIPPAGAQVLRQSQVGIDVAEGHDAYLQINGTTVRTAEDGLIRELGTGLIQFQPGPGKIIESLNPEENCVVAFVWDRIKGEATAETVSWCFEAT